jgi:hypothetical protein
MTIAGVSGALRARKTIGGLIRELEGSAPEK